MPRLKYQLLNISVWILFLSVFSSASGIGLGTALLVSTGLFCFWNRRQVILEAPLFWPFLLFAIAICLSVVGAQGGGYAKAVGKIKYFLVFFFLYLYFSYFPWHRSRICRFGAILSLILAVIATLQFFGRFDPLLALGLINVELAEFSEVPGLFHARGLLYHHNPFAYGMLLLFHLNFAETITRNDKSRLLFAVASIASAWAILLSGSRGAWLSLGISLPIIAVFFSGKLTRNRLLWIAIPIVIFALTNPSLRSRFQSIGSVEHNWQRLRLWEISIEMFRDAPIFGTGFHHGFEVNQERYMTAKEMADKDFPRDPHSIYFDLLATTGIVGFSAFLLLAISALSNYLTGLSSAGRASVERGLLISGLGCWICFLIGSAFDTHPFHTQTLVGTLFFLSLGQSGLPKQKRRFSLRLGVAPEPTQA